MRLVKFRIFNYKSILDSGDCYLASDITILAGKNESGKSNILESLRDFSPSIDRLANETKPLLNDDVASISLTFQLSNSDIATLLERLSTKNKKLEDYLKNNTITMTREFPGSYAIDDNLQSVLSGIFPSETIKDCDSILPIVNSLWVYHQLSWIKEWCDNHADLHKEDVVDLISRLASEKAQIADRTVLDQLRNALNSLEAVGNDWDSLNYNADCIDILLELIPSFVFFNSFEDVLPYEIAVDIAMSNNSVIDFLKVAQIDFDEIRNFQDRLRRDNYLSNKSTRLSNNFMTTWHQNSIELITYIDGNDLIFCVKEQDKTHKFRADQRSKGFQWFLSFYLRLNSSGGQNNVILIDEPGLYLHAKAQKDVLSVLEELSSSSQIIISTHSPYLLSPERLDRVAISNCWASGHRNRK